MRALPPTRALVFWALVLCATARNTAAARNNTAAAALNATAAATIRIECCALWATLNDYIQTHSGVDRSHCDDADCMHTGQIQSFIAETNAVVAAKLRVEGTAIMFPLATADEMQRLLVWAFLGASPRYSERARIPARTRSPSRVYMRIVSMRSRAAIASTFTGDALREHALTPFVQGDISPARARRSSRTTSSSSSTLPRARWRCARSSASSRSPSTCP